MPLEAATKASMHDRLLSLVPHERCDGRHHRAAVARAVARRAAVDMPGVQADRAVIAIAPARRRYADHHLAVAAPKIIAATMKPSFAALVASTASIRPGHC